jgi:predicted small secreted protein
MSTYQFVPGKKVQYTTNKGTVGFGKITEIRAGERGDWYFVEDSTTGKIVGVRLGGLSRP